ncbi:MAG: aminotransferase class V-fold PLP-dependent enzyme [Clostridia bacterium]|nr:aminotransferase class V-fold PLP-dependent enzyme [Clostridia bacterium]
MNRPEIREQMRHQLSDKTLFEQAKAYAYDYMDSIFDKRVYPAPEAIKGLEIFNEPLPHTASNPSDILELLHQYGSPATVAQTAGRYFGFVNGSSIPVSVAAKWLSDVWDQNAALYVISPIASKLEEVCEKWLVKLLGLPSETAAGFVGGSSTATLCGLAAGRNELLRKAGWEVSEKGLFGAPNLRVVLGEQAHASVFKALALLGIGKDQLEKVPVDAQGRMLADKLPKLDSRTLVIIQAGNVNTGAFDPIEEICEKANQAGAWVHVDGAFGLWAAASKNRQYLVPGLHKADSWSADAHKTLNAPYDCGIILCKRRDALVSALQSTGSYILYSENRDGMLYTPEMSRRARAVELWALLKYLGQQGLEELVDGLCERAKVFSEKLSANGFNLLNEVAYNQVLVSCSTPEITKATLENIQNSGECWCGGALWDGKPAIRISVCSWATSYEDIDRSVSAFIKARSIAQQQKEDSNEANTKNE